MPRRPLGARTPEWNNSDYTVIEGKALEPEHFSKELIDMLKFQGLLGYLDIKNDTYPELVKEFYHHLVATKIGDRLEITSMIRGEKMVLSEGRLAKLLKLTTTGIAEYDRKNWIGTPNLGHQDYLSYLLGRDDGFTPATRPNKQLLNAEQKILVMLVSDSLLPSNNKSKDVGSLECTFAYFLKHKVKFNLPALMLKHMEFCRSTNRLSLPYGMILSWIMVKKGINIGGTEARPVSGNILNAPNLRRYNIYQIDEGNYITLEEVSRKPLDERRAWADRLQISNKKLKLDPQLGAESENELEPTQEEVARGGIAPNMRDEDSVTNEQLMEQILRQNRIMEEGFASLNFSVRSMDQRMTIMERHLGLPGPSGASSSGAEDPGTILTLT